MNYETSIPQIMTQIGNAENVRSLQHCSTRLRFKIHDMNNVNIDALKQIEGIAGVKVQKDGIQLIVGQDVDDAYEYIKTHYSIENNKAAPATQAAPLKTEETGFKRISSAFFSGMAWISDCLVLMLPALIASGLTTAILTVLSFVGILSTESMTYQILSQAASAVLAFIPVMVVYSTAKKIDVSPMLSFAVIGVLLSSDLWALAGDQSSMLLFGFVPIRVFSYSSTIFPAILCVVMQKYIDKWVGKIVPKMFRMFLQPVLSFLILAILMLSSVGPIGAWIGDAMANLIIWGSEDYKWLLCFILAGFGNFLVGSGMHYCLIPAVIMIFTKLGYDNFYGAACFAGAFALAGSVLGAALKTRNSDVRQVTLSTGMTALVGVSEPAIYGVFFKYKSVMIADMIAGCVSGLLAGILGANAYGMAPAGITTIALFAGADFTHLLIIISVAFVLSFGLSYVMYSDKKEGVESDLKKKEQSKQAAPAVQKA